MRLGKMASRCEAAPAIAAGGELEKMRRRVRLSRLALFTAIAAGPVALAVAVASGPATAEAAAPGRPAPVRTAAVAADPAGYAQVFLDAWLRSSADETGSAQARRAQSLAPDVALPEPAAGARSKLRTVTAVRSVQRDGDAWSVTVSLRQLEAAGQRAGVIGSWGAHAGRRRLSAE
ncbi:hypothetical protein ABTZ21_36620 [Streptomyces sp. NPDC096191]|uniref:hypothetical protein n=1 Tax=Streptomyces sp. NPDC096191 TaxID=3155426 RepID=UPI003319CD61